MSNVEELMLMMEKEINRLQAELVEAQEELANSMADSKDLGLRLISASDLLAKAKAEVGTNEQQFKDDTDEIEQLKAKLADLKTQLYDQGNLSDDLMAECDGVKVIRKLKAELETYRWIPVTEGLPDKIQGLFKSKDCEVTDGSNLWVAAYNFSAYYWQCPSGDVTHWRTPILPSKGETDVAGK